MSTLEVRGHSRFERRASMLLRFLAGVVDAAVGAVLLEGLYSFTALDPLLDWKVAPLLAALTLGPWLLGRALLGSSLGELSWRIRSEKTRVRETTDELCGSFLTIAVLACAAGLFIGKTAAHPYWSSRDVLRIEAALPPADWPVLPFYYTLAPWPAEVGEQPVFYSVPYEVGPPKRFVGHVEGNWIQESVRITFEGPKTPFEYQSRVRDRAAIRECFETSPLLNPSCIELRRRTLERHLDELRGSGYAKFEARWFTAKNPGVSAEECAQGVLLEASAGERKQDRFILITPQGIHQAIALSYFDTVDGAKARKQFEISLGALRISEDLNPGKAWINRVLSSTRLGALPPDSDPGFLPALAKIQALLVSKLTVDPASFDSYYHLAGSSMLLLKYCMKHSDPELKSVAQAMVQRMSRFAHDLSTREPRLAELDRLVQDAKQL